MKSSLLLTALLVTAVGAQSPVVAVVKLLTELEARIQGDGKVEQQSYDKTACWCEETLARKAKDISDAKEKLVELQTLIEKLEGEVATHGAEITQLKKDIADNIAAQKEATEMRDKSNAEYESTKTEAEQCLGALEAAITVLTPAGTGAGFLSTSSMKEAQLISVAASIRPVLGKLSLASKAISEADLQAVRLFIEKPRDFVALQQKAASEMQVGNNPAGDYAPQSTQIQGVLKGLYDSFAANLEKANAEESDAQKAFEELMATKKAELETLEATLQKQESDHASKSKLMAESKALREDTEKQLKADEIFFQDTKDSCKQLATDWATRSRLRTEELQGIATALEILNSPEAQAIFANASSTLLQVSAVEIRKHDKSVMAAARLRDLAAKNPKVAALSALASQTETGGHFDKVIVAIDQMVVDLRKEEQEDIEHRDRCEKAQNKNANDMEDLNHAIDKTKEDLERMGTKAEDLQKQIDAVIASIEETEKEMEELLKMRNKAVAEFRQALKDDTSAVDLLAKAITALSAYYKKNTFLQRREEPEAEYTVDKDKMPDAGFSGADKRSGDSAPVIGMIEAIKLDLENEMKVAREEDAAAQKSYEKQRGAMRDSVEADTATKVQTEGELSDLESAIEEKDAFKGRRETDLTGQEDLEKTIGTDCSWVDTHFESRRAARKSEIDGLVEAKNYLAGSEDPL
jgi:predicted  nucleic acid-binding Zn-ribbon protein